MLKRSPRPLKRNPPRRSLKRYKQSNTLLLHNSQQDALLHALETLDNKHSLMLLQTEPELSQELLCLKASLAHQLNEHQLCPIYAKQALTHFPKCKSCLTVYLSHAENISSDDPTLNQQLAAALQEEDSELTQFLPALLRLAPNSNLYSKMVQDLQQAGSIVNKVGIIESNEGRKMVALQKINKNQQILFVPKSQLITLELTRTLPLVQKIIANKVPLRSPKHSQLAIFLLEHFELGNQSPFASYLSTLPKNFTHFPVNYNEELLAELKGTSFIEQVEHKKQDMRKDYLALVTLDQNFSRFSFKQFCEARLLVSSRVFGIVVEQEKTDALVPMADMLNHRLPKQTSWLYCDRTKGFVIQSLKEIPAGTEVFDSYGQKCNSRFLLNYGFVLPNNPHNQVGLEIHLANLPEGIPKIIKIRINRSLDSKGFEEMLGLLRSTIDNSPKTQDDSEEEITMGIEALKKTPFKNKENEIKIWRTIESIIISKLNQYPTSLQQDKKALQNSQDANLSNAIILRKGEKEVLNFYQTMSKTMIRFLESDGRRGDVSNYQYYIETIGINKPQD